MEVDVSGSDPAAHAAASCGRTAALRHRPQTCARLSKEDSGGRLRGAPLAPLAISLASHKDHKPNRKCRHGDYSLA